MSIGGGVCTATRIRALNVLGVATAGLYCNWLLLGPVLGRDLPVSGSYISELGALTRPQHTLVNGVGLCAGVCTLLLAVLLWRRLPQTPAWHRPLAALAIFGLATSLSVLWPMTCAPSVDPQCTAGGLTPQAGWQDLAESVLSVLADVALPLSVWWGAIAFAALPDRSSAVRGSRLLLGLTAGLTLLVGGLSLAGHGGGLPQRALDLSQAAWLVALPVWCSRFPPRASGVRPGGIRPRPQGRRQPHDR